MGVFTTALQAVLAYGTLILIIWAFVDAVRFTTEDYKAVDKMPRMAWLIALGTAFALMLWLGGWRPDEPFGPRSITWGAAVLLCAVYGYDMRPRLLNARAERLR